MRDLDYSRFALLGAFELDYVALTLYAFRVHEVLEGQQHGILAAHGHLVHQLASQLHLPVLESGIVWEPEHLFDLMRPPPVVLLLWLLLLLQLLGADNCLTTFEMLLKVPPQSRAHLRFR